MDIKDKKIGVIMTGSFCTFSKVIEQIKELVKRGADVLPIMSYNSYELDTKFGEAKEIIKKVENITGKKIIHTIQLTDVMLIAPCSGNTIAKLANGIIDTPATMAAKSHLRNNNPVVIAISTNDGLAGSAENIGKLLNRNNYYVVPFRQDNPITKPRSLVFDSTYIVRTIEDALDGKQIQPILL